MSRRALQGQKQAPKQCPDLIFTHTHIPKTSKRTILGVIPELFRMASFASSPAADSPSTKILRDVASLALRLSLPRP